MERIRAPKAAEKAQIRRSAPAAVQLASAIGNRAFALLARQPDPRGRQLHTEAQRLYDDGNYREALALWERARETERATALQNASFLFNIGMCNLMLERFATAIFFFEEYLEAPGADLELGRDRLERARSGAGVVEGEGGAGDARSQHRRAQRAFAARDFPRALVLWERARQEPNLSEAERAAFLFNVGMCNLLLERYGSAVAVFEEYLRSPAAEREAGEDRLRRARAGVGAPELAEAALAQPGDEPGQALHRQAQRLFDEGNFPEALAVWERARETTGVTPRQRGGFMFNIGMCNLRLERFATAIFFFEEYLTAPGSDQEWGRMQLERARRGAGVDGPGSRERDPRDLHRAAQRLYDAQDYRRALILWERARQQPGVTERERAMFLFNIGMCNLMLERFGSAVAEFEEYLESPSADRELGEYRLRRARAGVGGPALSAASSPLPPPSPSP